MRNGVVRGLLAGALVAGLIAAGCGDDDDNGDETASSGITKAEWIAQADEICASGDREVEQQAGEFFGGGKPKPNEITEFEQQVAGPAVEQQAAEIEALGAPEGDEEEVAAILEAARSGAEALQEDPEAGSEGALAEASQLAAEYGLEVCGQGGGE